MKAVMERAFEPAARPTRAADPSQRSLLLLGAEPLEQVAASPGRFAQLAVFSAATFLSVLNYSVLTPIYTLGEQRFHVGLQALNALANVRTFCAVPGVVLSLAATERVGLRASCLAGYGAQPGPSPPRAVSAAQPMR